MKPYRVIMISGWAHGSGSMARLSDALPALNCEITAPDQLLDAGVTIDGMSPYASALSEMSGPDEVILVGWSTGAMIALEMMCNNSADIKAAVLVGGTARFCTDSGYSCGTDRRAVRGMRLGLKSQPNDILEAFFRKAAEPAVVEPDELSKLVETALDMGLPSLGAVLEYLEKFDLVDKLSSVNQRVMLLHGTGDSIIPCSASGFLHDHLACSILNYYENAGHNIVAGNVADIAEDINQFIEGI